MSWLIKPIPNWAASSGLLVVRVILGAAFILHGWPKIQNPTGWMDAMPNPPPEFLQAVAAVIEFGGGILLFIGLFTRIAAVLPVLQMVAALALVHIPHGDPFVGKPGQHGAELACTYLAVSLLAALIGPGLWSLDAMFFGPRTETAIEAAIKEPLLDNSFPGITPPSTVALGH
ncbi:MAG TPA: DoxX family protein [Urbifossiella sp.]|jgi:putative oxidoreductase